MASPFQGNDIKVRLRDLHPKLIESLDPREVVSHLYAGRYLLDKNKEQIDSLKNVHDKNRVLLDLLSRKPEHVLVKFMEILRKTNQSNLADQIEGNFYLFIIVCLLSLIFNSQMLECASHAMSH